MDRIQKLTQIMITYYGGFPKYIQHFIKVHRFAQIIGLEEILAKEAIYG